MSTEINVTVGGGGLVEEAKRQQEEARWKQTERERWEAQQEARGAEKPKVDVEGWRRIGVIIRDDLAANRRPGGPAIGYSQLLSTSKTEGDFAVGLTYTWTCRVYSGDGTASVEVEHSTTVPGYSWAGGVGAPSYTQLINNHEDDEDTPIYYIGTPQSGYMTRSQVGSQYDGDLGISFPPSGPDFSPNVDSEGRRYLFVTIIKQGKREGNVNGNENVYVFPVGKGVNLVVTHYSRGWSIIETRSTHEGYFDYTGLPAPFPQFAGRGNYVIEGVSHSEGLHSSVKCVITSKTGAREVPTPAAFKARLDEVAGTIYDTSPKGGVRFNAWGVLTNPVTGETGTLVGGTYDDNYPIHSFPTPVALGGFMGEVQRTHGITQMVSGAFNWGIISGSPSAFYYLSVTDPEKGYEENQVTSVAWDQTIRTETGKRPKIAVPTTGEAPYEVKLYSGALPTEPFGSIAPDATGIGRRVSIFTPAVTVEAPPYTEGESSSVYLLRTTDWGDPSYCRAQLLALGFSAEDLTP